MNMQRKARPVISAGDGRGIMPIRRGLLGCGDIARKRVARAIGEDPNSRLLSAMYNQGQRQPLVPRRSDEALDAR
jgi:hypothetical protein